MVVGAGSSSCGADLLARGSEVVVDQVTAESAGLTIAPGQLETLQVKGRVASVVVVRLTRKEITLPHG